MTLPPRLETYPELDTWVRIDLGGSVTVFTGKAELGQGLVTALARIAAEELDVELDRVCVKTADTDHGLDEGFTAASMSLVESGAALRQAAAEAREHLLRLGAARLGVPRAAVTVQDGVVSNQTAGEVSYWELLGGKRFGRRATGAVAPKASHQHRIVGRREAGRKDLLGIVTGTARFVQDLRPDGVLHGRVIRPPGPGHCLASLDRARAETLPGVVEIVVDGSFVGVVAERECQAQRAADVLSATARWVTGEPLPSHLSPAQWLLQQEAVPTKIEDDGVHLGRVPRHDPPAEAVVTLESTYSRGYLMHGAIGPSAALALDDGELTVWSHSQGVYPLRDALATVLRRDPETVRVIHVPGPGCYGHNGADDAACDAALLAAAVPNRPILLHWTRADEHKWEPYGPPGVVRLRASLDGAGRIMDWCHELWSTPHMNRPSAHAANLLAGRHIEPPFEYPVPDPPLIPEVGAHRNAIPAYDLPRRQIVSNHVQAMPIRTSSLRALGAYLNVFAIEAFIDELADVSGMSRVDFRLAHLTDPRARAVLERVVTSSGWDGEPSSTFGEGVGLGFARYKNSAGYAAVTVRVTVDEATAAIAVKDVVAVADAGEVVDPRGLENQVEGGVIQALSWSLQERVTFDSREITSVDWDGYRIIRFPDVPQVRTVLLDRPGEPYLGAGEIAQGPTAAAVANAVRDAIGVPARDLPLTPERLRAAALVA